MLRLKTILQSSNIYLLICLISILISYILCLKPLSSKYDTNEHSFTGTLIEYSIDGDKLSFILQGKEKLKCTYYIKSYKEKEQLLSLKTGILLSLKGDLSIPNKNTIPNTFNYQNYLKSLKIKYILSVSEFSIKSTNINLLYLIKNKLINYINTYKSNSYLNMLILGNKTYLDEETYHKYQSLGISHIFAISGMHISLISFILLKLLNGLKDYQRYSLVIIFLIVYLLLIGFIPGVLRSIILFILLFLNKQLDFNISVIKIYYLVITIMLIINPYYLYNTGFLYSSIISYSLIKYGYVIKGNYILKTIKVSLLALLVSLPITINTTYEFNILSPIINLIYVPYISFILYPLCLLSLLIKPLDNFLIVFIYVIEYITKLLIPLTVNIPKLNTLAIIIYYSLLFIFLNTYQKKYILFIILPLLTMKYKCIFDSSYYIYYLDVKQGDSSILIHKNKSIMIDTGGKSTYEKEEWKNKKAYYYTDSTINFLKSLGFSSVDYLIITHGDYDHMGEAIHLVNNFNVKTIIFNCGPYNDLEKELIKVLDKKKIKYYSCIKELNIDDNKLYFLHTKEYDNENDNSNVIYTELNGYKFMFMGDASITTEKEIISKYNLSDIDVLKVGHHGSKTSSGKDFINEINPKYSIVSVGKNNRYGHPNKEVLENLKNSKIYRTDIDGSIMFKIRNNKLQVETCVP